MLIRVRLPPLVRFRKFLSEYTAEYMHIKSFEFFYIYICLELCKPGQQTFCNFPQLRLSNGLFTELLANVVFFLFVLWLGLCVDVAVDRISRISTSLIHSLPLFFFFFTLTTILFSRQVTSQLRCLLAVYVQLMVILTKVSRRASCKALTWDKVITIRRVCVVQYSIVFSFHLAKRINHPDPG